MTRRPTDWRNSFRALNRGPFALGLLCLLTAAMGVLGLVGTSITGVRPFRGEWWGSPWVVAGETVVMAAIGTALLVLYYRLRD